MDQTEDLLDLERQAREAGRNRDVEFFDERMADFCVLLSPSGILNRSATLKLIAEDKSEPPDYVLDEHEVVELGANTAIVISRVTVAGSDRSILNSTVYVKIDGHWRMAMHQATPLTRSELHDPPPKDLENESQDLAGRS